MMELFITAWDFVRRPSFALEEYIRKWPTQLSLWVLILFYIGTFFGSDQSMSTSYDLFVAFSDTAANIGIVGFYVFQLLLGSISIFLVWFVYPQVVKKFYAGEKDRFDEDLCRRLYCYAAFPFVVTTVFINLPLTLLTKPFVRLIATFEGASFALMTLGVLLIVPLLLAFVGWILVVMVMYFVIQWKGFTRFFGLSSGKKILIIFVIPFIASLPNLIFMYPEILKFLQNYPTFNR